MICINVGELQIANRAKKSDFVQTAGHFHDLAGHLVKTGTVPPKAGRLAGLYMLLVEVGIMIIPIDASYLYLFVVHKQQRQPLVNNIHVCDDTEGVSTAVHMMSIVQSERNFALCTRDPGSVFFFRGVLLVS